MCEDTQFEDNIEFDDSKFLPEGLINHINNLPKVNDPIPHTEILSTLLGMLPKVDFRKLAEIQENEKPRNNHLQILTVEQVLDQARLNNWGICRDHDFIYLFNGAYWNLIDVEEFKNFLGESAEKMGIDRFKARHYQFRDQLYKQFLASANLPRPDQPQNLVFINLKNGTFEISPNSPILRPFDRADFLTYQLPFEYDPDASAPLFMTYLNRVLPDIERQQLLSEYLGYVFIRSSTLKLEKTLLLYGTGANGKSVLFDIVTALLGDANVSCYSLQTLTNENGYYRAKLANKLVNYSSEINGSLETAYFKLLVSGEPVEARLPYGEPFTLKQYGKLIFNCNALPRDVEHTEAYFRRFIIIPFDVTIPENEQDPQLAQKIISSELSGIFNWVLDGLRTLLTQRHFSACESSIIARSMYEKQTDSVKTFLDEAGFTKSNTDYVLLKDIYLQYKSFCNEDGYKPVNKTNFISRLRAQDIILERKNIGNVFFLKTELPPF